MPSDRITSRRSSHLAAMPHGPEPLEIHLESPDIVLRGFTGDEFEPATLNGQVVLNLVQPTDLKEVS